VKRVKRRCNVQKIAFLAGFFVAAAVVEITLDTGTLIATADARVGRPLTPVSVAGVARRTTRRAIRRTAVYVAVLPAGCHTVIIEGTTLQQCGGTYYQASGSQYVVVEVN
jgi:hypothetical protein